MGPGPGDSTQRVRDEEGETREARSVDRPRARPFTPGPPLSWADLVRGFPELHHIHSDLGCQFPACPPSALTISPVAPSLVSASATPS